VANPQTSQTLNRQEQQHDRGQARVQNFQSSAPARQAPSQPQQHGGDRRHP
jgi:hypothetical protein